MGAERTIDMAEDKNIFFDSYELEQSDLADLADLFKVFGDATRISIMFALLKQELSVGDIAERLLELICCYSLRSLFLHHLLEHADM